MMAFSFCQSLFLSLDSFSWGINEEVETKLFLQPLSPLAFLILKKTPRRRQKMSAFYLKSPLPLQRELKL